MSLEQGEKRTLAWPWPSRQGYECQEKLDDQVEWVGKNGMNSFQLKSGHPKRGIGREGGGYIVTVGLCQERGKKATRGGAHGEEAMS